MTASTIRQPWAAPRIAAAWVLAFGGLTPGAAVAQDTQQQTQPLYETPTYAPAPADGLDRNYGLPAITTPGAELPLAKATPPDPAAAGAGGLGPAGTGDGNTGLGTTGAGVTGPDPKTASSVPDFFAGSNELVLPKPRPPSFGSSAMETPQYTTSDGSEVERSVFGEVETSSGDTLTPQKPTTP